MKSYDETVDAVFDRIHAYETKKKHRTALTRRITAACCAMSLLGGSVWLLTRTDRDAPIHSEDPSTGTSTTTTKEKVLITADPEDIISPPNDGGDGTLNWTGIESDNIQEPISPALREKMERYRNNDVVYAVIAEIFITQSDIDHFDATSGFIETNEEMLQLSEKLWQAYTAYVDAPPEDSSQKYSTVPDPEKRADYYAVREEYLTVFTELYGDVDEIESEAVRSRVEESLAYLAYYDAMVEWRTFISTTDVITDEIRLPYILKVSQTREDVKTYVNKTNSLRTQMLDEYKAALQDERLVALSAFCDTAPTAFASDTISGYYVELTADAINSLADYGYYTFRMASPDGSVEANWQSDTEWND